MSVEDVEQQASYSTEKCDEHDAKPIALKLRTMSFPRQNMIIEVPIYPEIELDIMKNGESEWVQPLPRCAIHKRLWIGLPEHQTHTCASHNLLLQWK